MNKKTIIILGIIFLIIVIIASYYFMKKGFLEFNGTGTNGGVSTAHNSINIKGYNIDINAEKEEESTINDSYFTTSFTIVDKNKYKCTYYVSFKDISLVSEKEEEEGMIYDIVRLDTKDIKINGKEFSYFIYDSAWEAIIFYELPDNQGTLTININGGPVFTSEGDQIKTLATVDESVIKSKELAEVMDFTVHK